MAVYLEPFDGEEEDMYADDLTLGEIYERDIRDAYREGFILGVEERQKNANLLEKISIIKNMREQDFSLWEIQEAMTSLSKEEVEGIYRSV